MGHCVGMRLCHCGIWAGTFHGCKRSGALSKFRVKVEHTDWTVSQIQQLLIWGRTAGKKKKKRGRRKPGSRIQSLPLKVNVNSRQSLLKSRLHTRPFSNFSFNVCFYTSNPVFFHTENPLCHLSLLRDSLFAFPTVKQNSPEFTSQQLMIVSQTRVHLVGLTPEFR